MKSDKENKKEVSGSTPEQKPEELSNSEKTALAYDSLPGMREIVNKHRKQPAENSNSLATQ